MVNPNTPKFWDMRNKNECDKLINSSIYLFKNKYILSQLSNKNYKLLNIGIGNGYFEKQIQSKMNKIKLFGVDISKESILNIRKRVIGEFRRESALRTSFKKNIFDIVIAMDVLEHFTSRELKKVMIEIYRVLKKNGSLIITVPLNENELDSRLNKHLFVFDENKLEEIFSSFGFKIMQKRLVCAFKSLFTIKNFINSIFNIRKHNLLILICKKR